MSQNWNGNHVNRVITGLHGDHLFIRALYTWELWWFSYTTANGQTVNAYYYCLFLEPNLRPALRKKRQYFLQNPSCCMTMLVRIQFNLWLMCLLDGPGKGSTIRKKKTHFYIIPKMKEQMCVIRFHTVPNIILQAVESLHSRINRAGVANGIL